MNVELAEIWRELEDFAQKMSGDRKTKVAACLVSSDGRRVFGANRLTDGHGLSEEKIAERVRPEFYDAMKCGEIDALDRAVELGFDLREATIYSSMFPCPRCAEKIAKTGVGRIIAKKHRVKHNGKFENALEDSKKFFDEAGIEYEIGEEDIR